MAQTENVIGEFQCARRSNHGRTNGHSCVLRFEAVELLVPPFANSAENDAKMRTTAESQRARPNEKSVVVT